MPIRREPGLEGQKILVVDDHAETRKLLVTYLTGLGCDVRSASGGQEGLAMMADEQPDLALLDLRMDDMDGLEVLRRGRAGGLARNFTMMSGEGTIPLAVDAIRAGASDFLLKPFELDTLRNVLCRVLGQGEPGAADDPRSKWRDTFAPSMRGRHESLLEIFLVLERIADTDCTVLITGESGTGKELVAQAIHAASSRSKRPMVPVNCGAIPETLIESELFGHTKGAFSGATQNREGRFSAADKGTLFLDEIGEMSFSVQVKLLRVLQEGEYVRVGETHPRTVDVRTIAATNKDLEAMAKERSFREDLFYRLNMIPIHLPPLRDRAGDVLEIAEHFVARFNERRSTKLQGFTPEAAEALARYPWPGNVRELENTIERLCLLHAGEGRAGLDDLPEKIRDGADSSAVPETARRSTSEELEAQALPGALVANVSDGDSLAAASSDLNPRRAANSSPFTPRGAARPTARSPQDFDLPPEGINLRRAVELFEANLIDQALERTGGNKQRASEILQLNRTTLVEKLRKRERRKQRDDR